MPPPGLSAAVARARRAVAPDPRPDGALLGAFVVSRDGAAFAALVERFGPTVFAVCRRVTGHHQDAEDAFQAVFVVLARKAGTVVPREAVGGWLYGVAVRTAREARKMAARRAAREAPLPDDARGVAPAAPDPDLAGVLDAELAALPEKYRTLLVRCDLRDEPQTAVAAALGIPVGTVYSRLAAARKRLAARLTARGVSLGVGGLAAALGGAGRAAVPADLPARAVVAALAPESAPAAVAALSHGVLRAMFLHKLKLAPLAAAAVACAALAAGLFAAPIRPAPTPQPVPAVRVAAQPPAPAAARPLPKGPNRILVFRADRFILVDPDGKNEAQVTRPDPANFVLPDAKLSPDGTVVAYLVQVGEAGGPVPPRRVLTLRAVGSKEEPADTGVDCEVVIWSPDGTALVATRVGEAGDDLPSFTHVVVDAKTHKATPLKLPADHVVTGWLADGRFVTTRLSGTPAAPKGRIYLVNRDGTGAKAVTDEAAVVGGGVPAPDGKRLLALRPVLAVENGRAEADLEELVLVDAATGRVTLVGGVPPNTQIQGYCWSSDGRRIAYVCRQLHPGTPDERANKETESRLVVADPDGRNPRTILTEKGVGQWASALGAPDWR